MAGNFVLRDEGDANNPVAARLYGLGITAGRVVFYVNNGTGSRTQFLAVLAQGARTSGDLGCHSAVRVYYAGFELPEFDANGARNWKFHKGVVAKAPAYKQVTAIDNATDTFTVPAHGYPDGALVALWGRGADVVLPAATGGLKKHTQYMASVVDADHFKLLRQVSGAPDIANLIDLTDNGTIGSPSRLFVYKADAFVFDPEQGRPEFFQGLDFTFSGFSYIEVNLPTDLSDGEDEPSRLKVIMNGKEVYDITLGSGTSINAALDTAGGTVSVSSTNDSSTFNPASLNNGDRNTLGKWGTAYDGSGGGWNSVTNPSSGAPEWVQVDFGQTRTINAANVITLRDDYNTAVDPVQDVTTFTMYGITDYKLQYWTGSAWADIAGTTVAGNNLVWRHLTFTPVSTSKIRLLITGALGGYARLVELEAYTVSTTAGLAFTNTVRSDPNPALVAADLATGDAKMPLSRLHGDSFIAWRDRSDALLSWVGGNTVPAVRTAFASLINATYDPNTATVANAGGAGDGHAYTEQFDDRYPSVEGVYTGTDFGFYFSPSNDPAATTLQGIEVRGGVLRTVNNTQTQNLLNVAASDRIKLTYENGLMRVYKNGVPLPVSSTTQTQLYTNYYMKLSAIGAGSSIEGILIAPSGSSSAPRQVKRYYGDIVASQPTPVADLMETLITLSAGCSWADVDGQVRIATEPDRTPCFTFTPSNTAKITVKRAQEVPNFYRYAYRDRDDLILAPKYITVDRKERRAANGGRLVDAGLQNYSVLTQSQMERIGETLARLNTDLDVGFTIEGFLDSLPAVKGSFVEVVDPVSGYTEASPALCQVIAVREGFGQDVETRIFEVRIVTPDFYSDTAHGAVTPAGSPSVSGNYLPPPVADGLTVTESTEPLPDGRLISSVTGAVDFADGFAQSGRVWLKSLTQRIATVTQAGSTFTLTGGAMPSGAQPLNLGSSTNNLPAGASYDTVYYAVNQNAATNTFQLAKTVGGAAEVFTTVGTGLAVYVAAGWADTRIDVQPDSTNQGSFEVVPARRGLNVVRVETRAASGATLGFKYHTTKAVDVVGDQNTVQPPSAARAFNDGLNIQYEWAASPTEGVNSYVLKDTAGRFVAQTAGAQTSFAETAKGAAVTRRIYAVGSSGVLSTGYAEVTAVDTTALQWGNIVGATESTPADSNGVGGCFTKTAATGWNAGARLTQAILTDRTDASLSAAPDRTDVRQVFGLTRKASPVNIDDFEYALDFRADGTVWTYQNTALAVKVQTQLGTYTAGERFEMQINPDLVVGEVSDIRIWRLQTSDGKTQRIPAAQLPLNGGFTEDTVKGWYNVGFAFYTVGSVSCLNAEISGALVPAGGVVITGFQSALNVAYDATTGVLTSTGGVGDGGGGASFTDFLVANQDGGIEATINQTSAFAVGLNQTDSDKTYGDIDFGIAVWDDNSWQTIAGGVVRNTGVVPVGGKVFVGREQGGIVARVDGKIVDVYTTAPSQLLTNALMFDVATRHDLAPVNATLRKYVTAQQTQPNQKPTAAKFSGIAYINGQPVTAVPTFNVANPTAGQTLTFDAGGNLVNSTPAGGMAIGSPVTGGGSGRVLYIDGAGNLAADPDLTFDGANLVLHNGTMHAEIALDASYKLNVGHAYAASDNVKQLVVNYYSGDYANSGIKLADSGNGFVTVLTQTSTGLYLVNGSGAAVSLTLGSRSSPNDGSELVTGYLNWRFLHSSQEINVGINTPVSVSAALHVIKTTEQQRLGYDASNYQSVTVDSAGLVTYNAVGTTPRFKFNQSVELAGGVRAGTGTATPKVGGKIFDHIADAAGSGTGYQGLLTDNIPANTLTNDGDVVEAEYFGSFAANANSKTVGVAFVSPNIVAGTVTENGTEWRIVVRIMRVSSTVARVWGVFETSGGTKVMDYQEITGIDWTVATSLALVATPAAASDIVGRFSYVKFLPKA